jgi:hypothetical protein
VLTHSLPYIRKLGVENIVAHRQPMLKRLHEEMPRLGFTPLTPPESTLGARQLCREGPLIEGFVSVIGFFTRWVVRLA